MGGVGGSGTRLIASILIDLGFSFGADLNAAHDNLWFTLLFKRQELWPLADHDQELKGLLEIFLGQTSKELAMNSEQRLLIRQLATNPRPKHEVAWLQERSHSLLQGLKEEPAKDQRWGWKEPNTHIFLPFLLEEIPDFKYIHVMRHGVDMAFSRNQNQLEFWGRQMLGWQPDLVSPVDSLKYWCLAHQRVTDLMAPYQHRFLLLNYDAFCAAPGTHLDRLLAFLEVEPERGQLDDLLGKNLTPRSLGRRHQHDLSVFDPVDLAYVQSLGFEP